MLTTTALLCGAGSIFLAGILRGFTGFGFALAAVPLASLFLPPSKVVAAVLLMQAAIGARDCVREWPRADRDAVLRLSIGALIGTPLGIWALASLPQNVVRVSIGLVVAAAVLASWRPRQSSCTRSKSIVLATGLLSGLCNGLAAMAGPAAIIYFLTFEMRQPVIRSSLLVFFPIASLIALPMSWLSGSLTQAALALAAGGMPFFLLGGWIGAAGFRRFGVASYRPAAIASLGATALASIVRGLAD